MKSLERMARPSYIVCVAAVSQERTFNGCLLLLYVIIRFDLFVVLLLGCFLLLYIIITAPYLLVLSTIMANMFFDVCVLLMALLLLLLLLLLLSLSFRCFRIFFEDEPVFQFISE